MSKPIVPEVSLIFDESKESIANPLTQPKSYKEWKQQQQMIQPAAIFSPNQTSTADRKKIVTFNLPNENQSTKNVQQSPIENAPMAICQQLDLSLCEAKKFNENDHRTNQFNYMTDAKQQDYNHLVQHQNNKRIMVSPQMAEENFKRSSNQMANQVMNQMNGNQNQADSKGITLNDVYHLLQNMQLNNASGNKENNLNHLNGHNIADTETHRQIEHRSLVPSTMQQPFPNPSVNHNETTMKELFSVILKQQEQLMNIQNQVHVLLMRSTTPASEQLEGRHHHNQIMADQNANINQIDSHGKQVGVMKSLEINVQNIKPNPLQSDENFSTPKNKIVNYRNVKRCGCMCNCDQSQQQFQSPDSRSNDDNFDTSPTHGNDTPAGWTFYGNILNQVNDVLQNTSPISSARGNEPQNQQQPTNFENCSNERFNEIPNRRTSNVMPNIRSAQFKQVGFQIDDVNISAMSKR